MLSAHAPSIVAQSQGAATKPALFPARSSFSFRRFLHRPAASRRRGLFCRPAVQAHVGDARPAAFGASTEALQPAFRSRSPPPPLLLRRAPRSPATDPGRALSAPPPPPLFPDAPDDLWAPLFPLTDPPGKAKGAPLPGVLPAPERTWTEPSSRSPSSLSPGSGSGGTVGSLGRAPALARQLR